MYNVDILTLARTDIHDIFSTAGGVFSDHLHSIMEVDITLGISFFCIVNRIIKTLKPSKSSYNLEFMKKVIWDIHHIYNKIVVG